MPNLFQQFSALLDRPPLEVATVTALEGEVATVTLPGGGTLRARGAGGLSIGSTVFVRGGVIEGQAAMLTTVVIEI